MSFVLFEESKLSRQHSNSLWNIANLKKMHSCSNSHLASFLENALPLDRAAIFSSRHDFSLRIIRSKLISISLHKRRNSHVGFFWTSWKKLRMLWVNEPQRSGQGSAQAPLRSSMRGVISPIVPLARFFVGMWRHVRCVRGEGKAFFYCTTKS